MKERLKELRKELHITQKQMAEALNVSKSAVESYEYGRAEMTPRTIADICRVYNVSEAWLRDGIGEMFEPAEREKAIAEIFAEAINMNPTEKTKRALIAFSKAVETLTDEQIEALTKCASEYVKYYYDKSTPDY